MMGLAQIVPCDMPFPHGICVPGWGSGLDLPAGAVVIDPALLRPDPGYNRFVSAPGSAGRARGCSGLGSDVDLAVSEIRATGHCDYYKWGSYVCQQAWSIVNAAPAPAPAPAPISYDAAVSFPAPTVTAPPPPPPRVIVTEDTWSQMGVPGVTAAGSATTPARTVFRSHLVSEEESKARPGLLEQLPGWAWLLIGAGGVYLLSRRK